MDSTRPVINVHLFVTADLISRTCEPTALCNDITLVFSAEALFSTTACMLRIIFNLSCLSDFLNLSTVFAVLIRVRMFQMSDNLLDVKQVCKFSNKLRRYLRQRLFAYH